MKVDENCRVNHSRLERFQAKLFFLKLAVLKSILCGTAQLLADETTASSGQSLWLHPGTASDIKPAAEPGVARPQPSDVDPVTGHVVRIAYIIPTNRTAQAHAVASLRNAIILHHEWYRDQMERNGFGPKTFRYETEPDGVTPKIYTVNVTETDAYLRGDLWSRTISAATAAGVPVWTSKQVWWLIPEAHQQMADGSIVGGTALGASFGSGDDAGVAMVGSDALARYQPGFFTNNAAYHNQVIPEIGPHLLKQNISFPSFEGTTFSSVASSVLGAALHEMTHGFGQPHDFRNDNNFHGNLMGNGLRGFRGALYPDQYASDYTRAGYGSALALNVSRYFNANSNFTDNTLPALTITTSGTNTPVNGLLQINFTCSDAGGLSAAWLTWSGDLVGEMALSSTSSAQTFATAYYNPGQTNQYVISIFDRQGNKRTATAAIIPRTGFNRAPRPFVKILPLTALAGQNVLLDASQSTDADHSVATLQVEWDLNGDGAYDTAPTTTKSLTHQFANAGNWLVRARVTDPAGAQTVSAPVALRVLSPPTLSVSKTADQIQVSWSSDVTGFALETTSALVPPGWQSVTQAPAALGNSRVVTFTNPPANAYFRLKK
jgi:PKD repeat protein